MAFDMDKELEDLEKTDVKEEKVEVKEEVKVENQDVQDNEDLPEKPDPGLLAEINELTGMAPVEPEKKEPEEKDAEGDKEPVKDAVEPGSDVKEPDAKPLTGEAKYAKLEEEHANLQNALKSERKTGKALKDQIDSFNNLGQKFAPTPKPLEKSDEQLKPDESDVDPDLRKTVSDIFDEKQAARDQKDEAAAIVDNQKFWLGSMVKVSNEHEDFREVTETFFAPKLDSDPELNKEFQSHDNPAQFAYDKAIEFKNAYVQEAVEAGQKKTTEDLFNEFKKAGLPVNLSQFGGTPSAPKGESSFDKDLDAMLNV